MKPQYGEEFLRKDSFFSIKPEILWYQYLQLQQFNVNFVKFKF